MIPLSLYIHFPWCIRKCPYCDFNSHNLKAELPEEAYIETLLQDLANSLQWVQNREIVSIFMGGGTPSLFSPKAIASLLDAIKQTVSFSPTIEISLEANPGTVEQERFTGFYQAGINRLSIGIQSFHDKYLTALGRIHDQQAAIKAAQAARIAGFTNLNLDLMFGLPNQTKADAISDLETAISLNPTHLSWYQLTLEPNTLFYHQPPVLPSDDNIVEMQEAGQQLLAKYGYEQYEVSAYCQNNYFCQHNRNYWEFGDYLGIGAGAHSKITDMDQGEIIRLEKAKNPKDYLKPHKNLITKHTSIRPKELIFEFMLNALRLKQPILFDLFEQRTLLSKTILMEPLQQAEIKGFIEVQQSGFVVTPLGWHFLNDLVEVFLT